MWDSQNGWFTRENPTKIWMMTGGTPMTQETAMWDVASNSLCSITRQKTVCSAPTHFALRPPPKLGEMIWCEHTRPGFLGSTQQDVGNVSTPKELVGTIIPVLTYFWWKKWTKYVTHGCVCVIQVTTKSNVTTFRCITSLTWNSWDIRGVWCVNEGWGMWRAFHGFTSQNKTCSELFGTLAKLRPAEKYWLAYNVVLASVLVDLCSPIDHLLDYSFGKCLCFAQSGKWTYN